MLGLFSLLFLFHLCMSERTSLTDSGLRISSLVVGHSPPLANVAPITAIDSQLTSSEHVCTQNKTMHSKVGVLSGEI